MSLLDRAIASLRAHHDDLAGLVEELDAAALSGPSAASEWSRADVLSHLGSGAEIMLAPLAAGVDGRPVPELDNQAVWARWDASSPADQAAGFVEHDGRLVSLLESLDDDQRASVRIDLGFLPEPVPLEVAVGMRLNEVAQHAWDVRAGLDATQTLDEEAADVLLALYAGSLGFMLGFTAKPDALDEPAVVELLGRGLVLMDRVALEDEPPVAPTATFTGPAEAAVRLLGGRLGDAHASDEVAVSGNVTLDDLRRVFPGF